MGAGGKNKERLASVASGATSIGGGTSDGGVWWWGSAKSKRHSWKGGAPVQPAGEDGVCAPQPHVGLGWLPRQWRGAAGRAELDVELATRQAALSAHRPAPHASAHRALISEGTAASVAAATPAPGGPSVRGRRLCQRGCVTAVSDGGSPAVGTQGLHARSAVAVTGQGMGMHSHDPYAVLVAASCSVTEDNKNSMPYSTLQYCSCCPRGSYCGTQESTDCMASCPN